MNITCEEGKICRNLVGSYTCECPDGYSIAEDGNCTSNVTNLHVYKQYVYEICEWVGYSHDIPCIQRYKCWYLDLSCMQSPCICICACCNEGCNALYVHI